MRYINTFFLCMAIVLMLSACTSDSATTGSTSNLSTSTSSITYPTDSSTSPAAPVHTHEWVEVSCTAAKTCISCSETEGEPLGHVWIEATCTTSKTCSRCSETEGDPLAHTWDTGVVTKEATEKEEGERLFTCTICTVTKTESIPVLNHIHRYDNVIVTDPTCIMEGFATYACNCGDSYTADETAPLGHTWQDASCVTPKTCSICGVVEGTVLDHAWNIGVVIKEATEEEEGEKLFTCTVCAATKTTVIPTLDHIHDYDKVEVTDPTCTAAGYSTHTCRCGDSYKIDETIALGHNWHEATCTAPKTCDRCSVTEGATMGHSWKEANCTEPKTCNNCGLLEGEANGHTWWSLGACTDPTECTVCGAIKDSDYKHVYSNEWYISKYPTCTESGLESRDCLNCWHYESRKISPLGHTEVVDAAVAPTCTNTGLTEGKHCSVCNEVLVAQRTVKAKGHNWKDATCTEPQTCIRCQVCVGNPTGHSWQAATCITPKRCSRCSATEGNALGHDWRAATCTNSKICNSCGMTIGAPIGHIWQNAVCGETKTCLNCGLVDGKVEHKYVDGICVNCGKLKPSEGLDFGPGDNGCAVIGIGRCYDSNIVIPDEYNGVPVTGIDANAFSGQNHITSIIIPYSVTYISGYAFQGCSGLIDVVLNGNITTIGDYTFSGCANLTNIIFPESVTNIGSGAFSGCSSLTSVIIPDGVISIGSSAFWNCAGLTSVTLPNSIAEIGELAFSGCTSLTSIRIPSNVTNIGSLAFWNCTNLTNITFAGTVEQWNSISKGDYWNQSLPATEVICSDGKVTL